MRRGGGRRCGVWQGDVQGGTEGVGGGGGPRAAHKTRQYKTILSYMTTPARTYTIYGTTTTLLVRCTILIYDIVYTMHYAILYTIRRYVVIQSTVYARQSPIIIIL